MSYSVSLLPKLREGRPAVTRNQEGPVSPLLRPEQYTFASTTMCANKCHGPAFARHPAARVTIVAAALAFMTSARSGGGTTPGVASVGSPSTTAAAATGGGSSSSQPRADETGSRTRSACASTGCRTSLTTTTRGTSRSGPPPSQAASAHRLTRRRKRPASRSCPGPSTPRRRRPLPTPGRLPVPGQGLEPPVSRSGLVPVPARLLATRAADQRSWRLFARPCGSGSGSCGSKPVRPSSAGRPVSSPPWPRWAAWPCCSPVSCRARPAGVRSTPCSPSSSSPPGGPRAGRGVDGLVMATSSAAASAATGHDGAGDRPGRGPR